MLLYLIPTVTAIPPAILYQSIRPQSQKEQGKGDDKRVETDEGHSSACNCLTARWQQNAEYPRALGSISCSPRRLCKEYCIFNQVLSGAALITLQQRNLDLTPKKQLLMVQAEISLLPHFSYKENQIRVKPEVQTYMQQPMK